MKKTDKNEKTQRKLSFLQLLAAGRIAEAEILLNHNPHLRAMLLHLPGLRHTRFFKNRIKFYKNYARTHRMAGRLSEDDRETLRGEFAHSHCKINALKKAAQKAIDSYDIAAFTTEISRIRFNQMMKKRRQSRISDLRLW